MCRRLGRSLRGGTLAHSPNTLKPQNPGHLSQIPHSAEIHMEPGPHTCSGPHEDKGGMGQAAVGRPVDTTQVRHELGL